MSSRPPLRATAVLLASFALGTLAELLLDRRAVGLNLTLWLVSLLGAWLLLRRPEPAGWRGERILLAAAGLLTLVFVVREDPLLRLVAGAGFILLMALIPLVQSGASSLDRLAVRDVISGAQSLGVRTALGLIPVAVWASEEHAPQSPNRSQALRATARGVVITVPALLVFTGLFANADQRFEKLGTRLIDTLFGASFPEMIQKAVVIGFFAWLSAGVLGRALVGRSVRIPTLNLRPLGTIEATILLASVDLLFGSFVLTQGSYFFGGSAQVTAGSGFTYAEYARRGFFELVTVGALAMSLLLVVEHWLADEPRARARARWLARVLVVLVLLVLGSAAHRMALYQVAYGLTTARLYASVFMGVLALTLVWFSVTVLRGAATRFVLGAGTAWAAAFGVLCLSNPEAMVVESNLARAERTGAFDTAYALSLSADAVPALVQGLGRLGEFDRTELLAGLQKRAAGTRHAGWREWTLASARARTALLHGILTPAPPFSLE